MRHSYDLIERSLAFAHSIRTKKKRRGPATPLNELNTPIEEEAGERDVGNESVIPEPVPQLDEERPVEMSKRDKRRARESRRKAEEEAQKASLKEERISGRKGKSKGDSTAQQNEKLQRRDDFVTPKKKGKGRVPAVPDDDFTEEKVAKVVEAIKQHREKVVDRWGEGWTSQYHRWILDFAKAVLISADFWKVIHRVYCPTESEASSPSQAVPGLKLLCLGLGKPYSDRSAQIQLALLLELSSRLQVGPLSTILNKP